MEWKLLSNCNALWRRSFLTKRECISLLPDKTDEILGLSSVDSDGHKNLLTCDEFYYCDNRVQKLLIDTKTGEIQEWGFDDEDALNAFIQTYPQISAFTQEIPTVCVAIVVQGKVMYDGPNALGVVIFPFVSPDGLEDIGKGARKLGYVLVDELMFRHLFPTDKETPAKTMLIEYCTMRAKKDKKD